MYSNKIKGIFWFSISRLALVALVVSARYLANTINPIQIVSFQNIFALLFFIPIFLKKGTKRAIYTKNLIIHFLRGSISVIGIIIWYYSFTKIPLPEALSISYSLPLFITIFAIIFLKENLNWSTFVCLFLGFIGMLLILRPNFNNGMTIVHWLIILVTILLAMANILNKILVSRKEKPYAIVFYMSFTAVLFTLPYVIKNFSLLNLTQILIFLFMGFLSNIAYLTTSISYGESKDILYLQPLDFIRLVFVVIASYFLFNETINITSMLGVAIIILSDEMLFIIKRKEEKIEKVKGEVIPNCI